MASPRRPLALIVLVTAVAAASAQTPAAPGEGASAPAPAEARARVLALADARRWDAAAAAVLGRVPDPGVRAAVARWCGALARPEAAEVLARLAADPAPAVRAAAVEAAGRLAASLPAAGTARPLLAGTVRTALGDADPAVRRAAAWAVGAGPGELGRELAGRLGAEPDPAVRAAILVELWRVEGDGWEPAAVAALGAADAGERAAAAWSLGRGRRLASLPALRRAASDADAAVRAAALEAGRRIDAAAFSGVFAAALADGDPRVRIAALAGLETAGSTAAPDPEATAALARAVADPAFAKVHERVAAVRAAGAIGCCTTQLLAAVAAGEPWVVGEALQAVARQGRGEAGALVATWAGAGEEARREAAVRAAARLADGGAVVAAALADPAPRVRLAAVESVAAAERAARLRPLLDDPDPAVRAAAVTVLAEAAALPPAEWLAALIARESGAAVPDAAVALVEALAAGDALAADAAATLRALAAGADPVVARAAWSALRRHGAAGPPPEVATGEREEFYREVAAWAAEPRWLQVVTWRGTMVVVLDTDTAPLTAYRLTRLAEAQYFDGLTFHRVVPNFVVQGGDPRGDGWGGPGFALRDELSLAPFAAGDVGMALAGPDTGGSQLFVTVTPQPHLVGRYPHVGRVVAGLEVATALRVGDRILRVRAGSGAPPLQVPVWYGPLEIARVEAAFPEYRSGREAYEPDPAMVAILAGARLRYELTVAMGTWCSDSRALVPALEKVVDALGDGSALARPRLLGIDRAKATLAVEWPFGPVELVPTVVVSSGGVELGRIVETPASGRVERDLVNILAAIEGFPLPE